MPVETIHQDSLIWYVEYHPAGGDGTASNTCRLEVEIHHGMLLSLHSNCSRHMKLSPVGTVRFSMVRGEFVVVVVVDC